jgi:hypothetical protein
MNEFECARAELLMPELVDRDLSEEQTAWVRSHLEACAECRAALARLIAIDVELVAWGERLARGNPVPAPRRARVFIGLAVAAAAALALVLVAPYRPVNSGESRFVEIPYLAPLDPRENATIVRMDIQVATLLAVGYRLTADPDTVVPADVLVGEDGRAHAIRVLSDVTLSGAGD